MLARRLSLAKVLSRGRRRLNPLLGHGFCTKPESSFFVRGQLNEGKGRGPHIHHQAGPCHKTKRGVARLKLGCPEKHAPCRLWRRPAYRTKCEGSVGKVIRDELMWRAMAASACGISAILAWMSFRHLLALAVRGPFGFGWSSLALSFMASRSASLKVDEVLLVVVCFV